MTQVNYKIAIIGSGPAGLSAAARAAELGVSHVLLEAERWVCNTIYRYQKGKHVMAEPCALPLRSPLHFEAGQREVVLRTWEDDAKRAGVVLRRQARVMAIEGQRGSFTLKFEDKSSITAETVVLAIGMQGNLRKLGCPGEDLDWVQYQLDDPEEYRDQIIVVVGAGDAAIENALALARGNKVYILNRRDEFDRAKPGNLAAIQKAIDEGRLSCLYNAWPLEAHAGAEGQRVLRIATDDGESELICDRVIARLGATPPRAFVESCGVVFPSLDPNSVPAISPTCESNVAGLYIVGALAGFPLIKQAMNQGYEVIEAIEGRSVEPSDTPLLRRKFASLPNSREVDQVLATIRRDVPILSALTPLQLREFMIDSDVRTPLEGELIFEQNDYSDTFFSIVSGEVEIEVQAGPADSKRFFVLGQGDFFGEMSLISGRRRSATVRARRGAILLETPRRSMNKLINSVAAVRQGIDEVFVRRFIQTSIAPSVSVADIAALIRGAEVCQFRPGEALFKQNDVGNALYLIRRGSVTIAREIGGREVVLAYVPAGQYVGEMALLSDLPRSATVRAAVNTEAIKLDCAAFKALLMAYPSVREGVQEVYRTRMTQNLSTQSEPLGDVLSFMMAQGLGEATDVLLIDESLCVRCDHCEKACADTHGNLSRLDRKTGPSYGQLHVPTSCRHCEHPHCMKDCPPDAIRRTPQGEVYITDACIGCGNCERNCPYGVIQMGIESRERPSLWRWMMFGGDEPGTIGIKAATKGAKKAAKCDMCKDLASGPACVRACPTGAALRASPEQFVRLYRGEAL